MDTNLGRMFPLLVAFLGFALEGEGTAQPLTQGRAVGDGQFAETADNPILCKYREVVHTNGRRDVQAGITPVKNGDVELRARRLRSYRRGDELSVA